MKRTKEWWSRLTKDERSELYWLERSQYSGGGSAYIPDDCTECGRCGTPHLGYGLCRLCLKRLIELVEKAGKMEDVRFCPKCHHSIVACGCDKNYVLREDVELYPE